LRRNGARALDIAAAGIREKLDPREENGVPLKEPAAKAPAKKAGARATA